MRHPRNNFSRFIPILLVIVVAIVAVTAVIAIGRALFGGGADQQNTVKVDEGKSALLSTDIGRSVKLTVRGPIVADENFRSYTINVSPSSRSMTTYEGYLDKQIAQEKLSNNHKAYEELVYALDKRKMMEGTQLTDEQNDLRGICASGRVYIFETLNNNAVVERLWTSDCGGSKGSAKANVAEILDMFLKQIPNGRKMATDVGLNQDEALFKL